MAVPAECPSAIPGAAKGPALSRVLQESGYSLLASAPAVRAQISDFCGTLVRSAVPGPKEGLLSEPAPLSLAVSLGHAQGPADVPLLALPFDVQVLTSRTLHGDDPRRRDDQLVERPGLA